MLSRSNMIFYDILTSDFLRGMYLPIKKHLLEWMNLRAKYLQKLYLFQQDPIIFEWMHFEFVTYLWLTASARYLNNEQLCIQYNYIHTKVIWNCFVQDTVRTWNTFQIVPMGTYSFWSVFNYALCICHLPFINSVFLLSPSSSSKRIFHFVQWKPASKYFMDFMIFDVRYDVKNRTFGPCFVC